MAKQPTLFNFFKKVTSPAASDKSINISETSEKPSPIFRSPSVLTPSNSQADAFRICSLIWAKLDGYPWWPAMVCQDPDTRKHITKTQIHVQFFDKPPSRSWVKKDNCVVPYKLDADQDKRKPANISESEIAQLETACAEADRACKIPWERRDSLLVDFASTPSSDQSLVDSPGTDKENSDEPSAKKPRVLDFSSGESGDEYNPGKNESDEEDSSSDSGVDEEENEEGSEPEESPQKNEDNRKRKRGKRNSLPTKKKLKIAATPTRGSNKSSQMPSTPSVSSNTLQKIAAFKAGGGSATPSGPKQGEGNWPHLSLPFLQPENIMDKHKRRPDHPEYDRRTLYVPDSFKNSVSPGMRQWWDLKAEHWDCVLLFKVGKFYELYHMDAVLGVNELSLSYMRGEFAHSGFPEIAYSRFSTILVQKGHKVARVEQMETPDMMAERCKTTKKNSKFDKVVAREVCQVASKGTLSHSVIDGDAVDPQANYLLALVQKELSFGVCFVDTSIGIFHLGQFEDDKFLSRLRTLLSHTAPVQVIFEKKSMSESTLQVLSCLGGGVVKEALQPGEVLSGSKTLSLLAVREELQNNEGQVEWPEVIRSFSSPSDSLGLTPSDNGELALRALGCCINYLQRSFLDTQLLALKQFKLYSPTDAKRSILGQYMVLDDVTLTNLEILKNSRGGSAGSLLARVDHCTTFPGKRLLRQWLCSPLCNVDAIRTRQEAVAELNGDKHHIAEELKALFKSVPDLERLMARIHAQGNAVVNKNHPDSRAIFFEEKTYSKRKIQDLLLALTGFQNLQKALELLRSCNPSTALLKSCADSPDLSDHLQFFQEAFDHEKARKEGCIIPLSAGLDLDYDEAMEELKNLEKETKEYLSSQCRYFNVQVKYFGSDKNRFQLEVSETASKSAGSQYEFTSSRKGFKRFTTKETREFLKRQMAAEEARTNALRDLSRKVFHQFSERRADWDKTVQALAQLDVLISLANFARSEDETCVPIFHTTAEKPFANIKNGRHPCIPTTDGFIPNSMQLGCADWGSLVLLTGPNMGGKSTLLRQLGLHVILAHVGANVPATSADLTPVDRVFTRIGASDDILAGESTFYQELSETGVILQHASEHSIVLVDELGRGTSTYDGTAIAHAVVGALAKQACRTIFSTHYHSLVEDVKSVENVSLGHMACLAEGEGITFLYQFVKGACPSSHGFNAARLAGLPDDIIRRGQQKAEHLVKEGQRRQLFRKLCRSQMESEISHLVSSIATVLKTS